MDDKELRELDERLDRIIRRIQQARSRIVMLRTSAYTPHERHIAEDVFYMQVQDIGEDLTNIGYEAEAMSKADRAGA